jgi:DNA-directed RNA polymerase specialized sigma24 family protein
LGILDSGYVEAAVTVGSPGGSVMSWVLGARRGVRSRLEEQGFTPWGWVG